MKRGLSARRAKVAEAILNEFILIAFANQFLSPAALPPGKARREIFLCSLIRLDDNDEFKRLEWRF